MAVQRKAEFSGIVHDFNIWCKTALGKEHVLLVRRVGGICQSGAAVPELKDLL